MKPGLSVHMMVKDPPVDRMALLVDYLSGLADEFVIIETGGDEEVQSLMRSWTPKVRVYYEPFVDFSTTRNKGLERHEYAWTLGVDPDEIPSVPMMQHIQEAIATPMQLPWGWLYWTRNYWGGIYGPEEDYHWHTRLWRSDKGRLYRPIHELVKLGGLTEAQTRDTAYLKRAPKEAYLIHSKPAEAIKRDDAFYATLGSPDK